MQFVRFRFIVLVTLVLSVPLTSTIAYETPGSFELLNGDYVGLESYQGNYILIDAFATWCLPCETQIGYLHDVYDITQDADESIKILSISFDNGDTLEKVENFRDKFDAPWQFGLDSEQSMNQFLDVDGYPTTFLLDKDGKLLKKWLGLTDSDEILTEMDKYMELPGDFGRQLQAIDLIASLMDSPLFVFFTVVIWIAIIILLVRIYRLIRTQGTGETQ